jgi:long-chain acyl-CoA synthetase
MTKISRLFDFPYYQLEKNNISNCLVTKYDGKWIATSTQEYLDKANAISRALLRLGIKKNDKIAIISSNNRTEWHIMDIGVLQIGAQNVPIYPTISEVDYAYILNHSEAKYCFVSDEDVLKKINLIKQNTPNLIEVYSFNKIEGCKNWEELLELGRDSSNQDVVEDRKNSIDAMDLATIIYTSGTTGQPKGVMLSHNNIVSNVLDSANRIPFHEGKSVALSFLPICHIYERMLHYLYMHIGCSIYFAESLDTIGDNIREVKPHVFTAVPRLIEKVFDKIMAKGDELTGIKRSLFFWAVGLAEKYDTVNRSVFYNIKLGIARKLIFKKWQEALGGEVRAIASGSAALQPRVARIFLAADIPILEGYGLTETSPVCSVNSFQKGIRIGSVGAVVDGVEVKIAEDGEILVKGPNVMVGYFNLPQQTAEVLKDGWFHTGDIGEFIEGKFLKITDRKKEIFKTSGGKYIIPQAMENKFKESRFIEQIMVIGEGQKFPAALIVPTFTFVREWAKRKELNLEELSNEDLCKEERVLQRIQKEVDRINADFGQWEMIKKFELIPQEFSIDGGELTPTLKFKRKIIMEKYANLVDRIFK